MSLKGVPTSTKRKFSQGKVNKAVFLFNQGTEQHCFFFPEKKGCILVC